MPPLEWFYVFVVLKSLLVFTHFVLYIYAIYTGSYPALEHSLLCHYYYYNMQVGHASV